MTWRMSLGPADRLLLALVRAQAIPVLGLFIRQFLKWHGTDIPPGTLQPGHGLQLQHGGRVVVHYKTRIGNNVALMQGCTIGRGDLWQEPADDFGGVVIRDEVIVGAGAVVLCSHGTVTVGRGTVVGANAVLTRSTGEFEVWAGQPARKIGERS